MELIKKQSGDAKVYVNKLAAAERQIASAIRMYFMEEDPLAIHIVASAAFNIYGDLLRHRGKEFVGWAPLYGMLRVAKNIAEGTAREETFKKYEKVLDLIEPYVEMFRKNLEIDISELMESVPKETVRDFWSKTRKAYNFLKHADYDKDALLDEDTVNNEDIIYQACAASIHFNLPMDNEKEFFFSAMYAIGFINDPPEFPRIIWLLKTLSRDQIMTVGRWNFCYNRTGDEIDQTLVEFLNDTDRTERALALLREAHGDLAG